MTAQRNALEAYIKMMQQGRIGVNRNGTIRHASLSARYAYAGKNTEAIGRAISASNFGFWIIAVP